MCAFEVVFDEIAQWRRADVEVDTRAFLDEVCALVFTLSAGGACQLGRSGSYMT